jgi:hypothetical protein
MWANEVNRKKESNVEEKTYKGEQHILARSHKGSKGVQIGIFLFDYLHRMHNHKKQFCCPAFRKIKLKNGSGCYFSTIPEIALLLEKQFKDTGREDDLITLEAFIQHINTVPKETIDIVNNNCGKGSKCMNGSRRMPASKNKN